MTRPSPKPQPVRLPPQPRPVSMEALRGPSMPVIRGSTMEFGE